MHKDEKLPEDVHILCWSRWRRWFKDFAKEK